MRQASRLRVLILFGGASPEHEVSCLSARNVLAALDPSRYLVTTVGVTHEGRWILVDGVEDTPAGVLPRVPENGDTVALVTSRKGPRLMRFSDTGTAVDELGPVDVCFPVMHGPYGEDGTVQGLLASHRVPYVGAGVGASALGIDKRRMKDLFTAHGLPQVSWQPVDRGAWEDDPAGAIDGVEAALGYPVFTKPARQGSSIGVRRCPDRQELVLGLKEAFDYDRVAIVEQAAVGARELECGVLGNSTVEVTPPGDVSTSHDFYDFEGKYLDDSLQLRCPADVPSDVRATCMAYAREAYLAIGARGMSRVDFFYLQSTGRVLINEINTIPGFTPASMFPYVWSTQGLDYPALVDRLLNLALEASHPEARFAP